MLAELLRGEMFFKRKKFFEKLRTPSSRCFDLQVKNVFVWAPDRDLIRVEKELMQVADFRF